MTDITSPVVYQWSGEEMVPLKRFHNLVNGQFVVGETYMLAEIEERSVRSHQHYFASINEAWRNLPEHLAERFPSAEHLRKWALIKTGYRDERSTVCASKAEALRVAAFIRPIDDYAVVVVRDAVVIHWTAKSQKLRAMGAKTFQASKDAVLNEISNLIGVDATELRRNTGKAA